MRRSRFILLIGILFCLVGLVVIRSFLYPVPDVTWLMHCTRLMLAGKQNYYAYFETNPPLIFFLYLPAVYLANSFHLSDMLACLIWVSAITILMLFWYQNLLWRIFKNQKLVSILSLTLAVIFLLMPLKSFAEREVLSLLLALPYLFLMTLRLRNDELSKKESFSSSLLMAIAMSLKPYFLFVIVFIEGYYLIKQRSIKKYLRPEPFIIIAFMLFYLLAVIVFDPVYFTKVLPLTAALYIPANSVLPLLSLLSIGLSMAVIFSLVLFFWEHSLHKLDDFSLILILAAIGYFLAFLVAGQAWYYHIYPALMLCCFLLIYFLANYFKRIKTQSLQFKELGQKLVMLFTLIIAFCYCINASKNEFIFKNVKSDPLNQLFTYTTKHLGNSSALIISIAFTQSYFRSLTAIQPVSRFPSLSLLIGLKQFQLDGKQQAYQHYKKIFFALLMQDINKNHPSYVILISEKYWVYDKKTKKLVLFNVMKLLNSDPHFKQFFSHFTLMKKFKYFKVYQAKKIAHET